MFLKNDKIVARVGNTVFRSWKQAGVAEQFVLDPTAVLGWTDGTAARRPASQRPVSAGDFYEKHTMGARVISFTGTAVASSRAGLQKLRDELVGLLADGEYQTLSVETSADKRYSIVGLEGTTSFTQMTDTAAIWKIDMFAPDPYIYGEMKTESIGSSNFVAGGLTYILTYPLNYNVDQNRVVSSTITNNGNVDAWPLFRVTGNYTGGFSITDGYDGVITYQGPVTMQSPVTIDMGAGSAIQNGVDKSVLLTSRKWWSVSPGEVVRPRFIPIQSGVGWCDIIIRDTWI